MANVKFQNFGTAGRLSPTKGFQVHGTAGGSPVVNPMTVQSLKVTSFVPKKSPLETAGQIFTVRPPSTPKVKPALADALPPDQIKLRFGTVSAVTLAQGLGLLKMIHADPSTRALLVSMMTFAEQPELLARALAEKPDLIAGALTNDARALQRAGLIMSSGLIHGEVANIVRSAVKLTADVRTGEPLVRLTHPLGE